MNDKTVIKSDWDKEGFSQRFSKAASIQIPMREKMFKTLFLFFNFHFKHEPSVRILDLGCGDGVLISELLNMNPNIKATLVDGSAEMVDLAKKRFDENKSIEIIHARFEDLITTESSLLQYDLVISSLAIHHLTKDDRRKLFVFIYSHLTKGGYFINIDTVLPPEGEIEEFYLLLWEEWIDEVSGITGESDKYHDLIYGHHQSPNHLSRVAPLVEQLTLMEETGFIDIDCIMKYGIFAMYIGRKP